VIAAVTGQPLAKARVRFSTDSAAISDAVFTDVNGFFTFSGLPAGRYTLSAEKAGYAPLRYGSKGPFDPPAEIIVAGDVVDGIDVALLKGAAVVGRISDDQGDPIVGGVVSLSAVQLLGSELRLVAVPRGRAETNDLGDYRIGDLPPGRYFVNVEGAGLGTLPSGMPREWERLKAWGLTFFPGSGGIANATPLAIVTGEERSGVDFAVVGSSPSMLFLSVSGGGTFEQSANAAALADNMRRLTTAAAASPGSSIVMPAGPGGPVVPPPPVTVTFVPADTTLGAAMEGNTQVRVGSGFGSYAMPVPSRVGPGNWLAVARQDRSGAIVQFTVSQGDSNVPLNIALAPQSRVSGRVVFEGTTRAPAPASVKVDVHGAGPDAAIQPRVLTSGPVTPKADGTFDIADVMGTIVLGADAPPGWTLKAVRYDGRDLLDYPLVLKGGVDVNGVEVVLSDQVATLSGATADSSGQPVSSCMVAVFPAATAEVAGGNAAPRFNARRMRLVRADQTGRFAITDLPSGSYFAAAATDIDASVWLTPEFLDRLRAGATAMTLGDREQKTVSLSCEGAR
jgi:hypothetical protein